MKSNYNIRGSGEPGSCESILPSMWAIRIDAESRETARRLKNFYGSFRGEGSLGSKLYLTSWQPKAITTSLLTVSSGSSCASKFLTVLRPSWTSSASLMSCLMDWLRGLGSFLVCFQPGGTGKGVTVDRNAVMTVDGGSRARAGAASPYTILAVCMLI